jgi:hypothetical protein
VHPFAEVEFLSVHVAVEERFLQIAWDRADVANIDHVELLLHECADAKTTFAQ